MIRSEVEVGSRNSSDSPFGFGAECLRLIIRRGARDDFITMLVNGSRCCRCQLRLFLGLLLDFDNLLSLCRWGAYLHNENNVSNFRLCQRSHIDVVLLAVISENKILELHFNLDPFFIRQ